MPQTDSLTVLQLQDLQWEACRSDRNYFLKNFYYIPVIGSGPTLFVPRDYQQKVFDTLDGTDYLVGLKARQIGWTTLGMGYAFHDAVFNAYHPWLLVSRGEGAAIKMLNLAKFAYARLPQWMKNRIGRLVSETQSIIAFENGSRLESVPSTGSTGRGDSVFGALLDECAFMDNAESIWGAVEPLVYGKAMLFSTANGMGNFYHETWLDSQRPDTAWEGLFFAWDVVPERDQDWYDKKKFLYRGKEWLFFQEYPYTPAQAFAKSGRVAFTTDSVETCFVEKEAEARFEWIVGQGAKELAVGEDADIMIDVWTAPTVLRDTHGIVLQAPNYVVGVDVAEGLDGGDFSYVTVFDANTGEQCLSSKSSIPVGYLSELVLWVGEYYFNALIVPERNNAGILVAHKLGNEYYYPRLYRMDLFGQLPPSSDRTPRFGWFTDRKSKPKMVLDFALALAEGQLVLHDREFVFEAQTFVADGKGSYSATSGNHDDIIMGTLIGWQGVLDSPQYPVVFVDPESHVLTWDEFDALSEPVLGSMLDRPLGQDTATVVSKSFFIRS